jgi:serine/threonine protein kinase
MFDLRVHGFVDCSIGEDFTDSEMPTWRNISKITVKTVQGNSVEHHARPLIDSSGNEILPLYEWGAKMDEGAYGRVYRVIRKLYYKDGAGTYVPDEASKEDIVVKESPVYLSPEELSLSEQQRSAVIAEDIQTHIHEATVLAMAFITLKGTPMEYAIPRVYEVFLHAKIPKPLTFLDVSSVCIAMEYIHGRTMSHFLETHFKLSDIPYNDRLFLHFLKQMASLLQILQTRLRMNHRDIKINNILIRDPHNPFPKLVLIDYGFACIAKGVHAPDAEMSKIEAGSYFGSRYACFKRGRDLCQFIYCIHCYFSLDRFLSPDLLAVVRRWMMITYSGGVANLLFGLNPQGVPATRRLAKIEFDEGIYLFLRRQEVDPLQCSPEAILADIAEMTKQPK